MAYTIVTVAGTGDEAQYQRIADELVVKSRIYHHLCNKILKRARNEGLNRKYRIRYKDELHQLTNEFNAFVRYANARIAKADKEIEYLTKQNITWGERRAKYQSLSSMYKGRTKSLTVENAVLRKKLSIIDNNERFFKKKLNWFHSSPDYVKAEMLLRSVLGYEEMKSQKLITTEEVLYLSAGIQLESFGRADLEERFGLPAISSFKKTICKIRRDGWVKKINSVDRWYLTVDGKARFMEIMKAIYGRRMSGYWKDIFNK